MCTRTATSPVALACAFEAEVVQQSTLALDASWSKAHEAPSSPSSMVGASSSSSKSSRLVPPRQSVMPPAAEPTGRSIDVSVIDAPSVSSS